MKFCRRCGKSLPLFANRQEEDCPQCTQATASHQSLEDTTANTRENSEIFSATLSCRDGRIMLTSKEGWLLWSGAEHETHTLQHMLDRSAAILAIRQKRRK